VARLKEASLGGGGVAVSAGVGFRGTTSDRDATSPIVSGFARALQFPLRNLEYRRADYGGAIDGLLVEGIEAGA